MTLDKLKKFFIRLDLWWNHNRCWKHIQVSDTRYCEMCYQIEYELRINCLNKKFERAKELEKKLGL